MKPHVHTRVVHSAASRAQDILDNMAGGPMFMQDGVSPRAQRTRDRIAAAPADIQALVGQYPQEFVARLARLMEAK